MNSLSCSKLIKIRLNGKRQGDAYSLYYRREHSVPPQTHPTTYCKSLPCVVQIRSDKHWPLLGLCGISSYELCNKTSHGFLSDSAFHSMSNNDCRISPTLQCLSVSFSGVPPGQCHHQGHQQDIPSSWLLQRHWRRWTRLPLQDLQGGTHTHMQEDVLEYMFKVNAGHFRASRRKKTKKQW